MTCRRAGPRCAVIRLPIISEFGPRVRRNPQFDGFFLLVLFLWLGWDNDESGTGSLINGYMHLGVLTRKLMLMMSGCDEEVRFF